MARYDRAMPRIISGAAKGRRFSAPPGERTRPTSDRVREAVFNAVVSWADTIEVDPATALDGIAWLDLFAGSGAMSLEAASRGADPVLAVEADRRTARQIERTARDLDLLVQIQVMKVQAHLSVPPAQRFDVVWADPPYPMETSELDDLVAQLSGGWLARTALVMLERDRRSVGPTWPTGFTESWERRYGDTIIHFAHWEGTP